MSFASFSKYFLKFILQYLLMEDLLPMGNISCIHVYIQKYLVYINIWLCRKFLSPYSLDISGKVLVTFITK